ncbi:hypothetical protein BgiMline_032445 [Biomphalaria glabrata]
MNDRLNKKENDSVRDLDNRKMSGADKGRIKPTNLAPSHHLFFKASSKQAKHNLDNIHSSCPVNKSTPLGNSRAGHEQSHARSTAERE